MFRKPLATKEVPSLHGTFLTSLLVHLASFQYKVVILSALLASSSAFAPSGQLSRTTLALNNEPEIGAGGMADTRNPDSYVSATG